MKFFRINIYLSIKNFFKSIFSTSYRETYENKAEQILLKNSNKSNILFTSQCRVSLLLVLKFFKKQYPKKNEIIFSSYNLPEMINVSNNLNFKTILCDLDYKTGFFDMKKLKRKVDNFKILKNKKKYSGIHGDFTLYSFNIMKNISALYGGAATSNNKDFALFSREEIENFKNFPKIILIKQVFIFFLLKTLSIVFLYRLFFFRMIRLVYIHKIKFVLRLFYPVLKFKIRKLPNYYFTKIPFLSKKLIFYQLTDIERRNKNHQKRKMKNIYYFNKFLKFKIKDVKLLDIRDFNYQNFVDFPILVKNRERLNKFLLNKGIETRLYYYKNCGKIF